MFVAIKYEKINLTYDKFIFKPVGLIKGEYEAENNLFITDYGETCYYVCGELNDEVPYYGELIEYNKLVNEEEKDDEFEILNEYYNYHSNEYKLGYFDYERRAICLLKVPYEEVEKTVNEYSNSDMEEAVSVEEEIITEPVKQELSLQKEESNNLTLKELRKEVKAVIKGEDTAVDTVTRGFMINKLSQNPKHKSHMMIIGPSGTGKTDMISIIAKKLNMPYFIADATAYTKEGYVGKSIYSMFENLIEAADGDIEMAQNGILIIDEIDKKITQKKDDPTGADVLKSLLKIMDRGIIDVSMGSGSNSMSVLFDTSNLTIVFMGAFEALYKEKEENLNKVKNNIGFQAIIEEKKETDKKIVITNNDLIKAGVPAEFIGRIPIITFTDKLEIETLVEILYNSRGGTLDEEKEFCNGLGITLKYTNGYIQEIAKKAYKARTGARDLRKLVRESLYNAYDEILSGKKVKTLKLTKQTALDNKKYTLE